MALQSLGTVRLAWTSCSALSCLAQRSQPLSAFLYLIKFEWRELLFTNLSHYTFCLAP